MADIRIRIPGPGLEVLRSDVEFDVRRSNRRIIGTLKVSQGSCEWRPVNHSYGYELRWDVFDGVMRTNARKKRRR